MRMVASVGSSPSCRAQKNGNGGSGGVCCAVSSSSAAAGSLRDQYRMLRIQPGASEKEVKKAVRQLALQYHPDVCRGSNCSVQFHQITEAYDMAMSSLRQSEEEEKTWESNVWGNNDKQTRGMYDDSDRDLWEEWMGWEGAGIRDYSSHINPIYEPSSYLRRIWSFDQDHSSS